MSTSVSQDRPPGTSPSTVPRVSAHGRTWMRFAVAGIGVVVMAMWAGDRIGRDHAYGRVLAGARNAASLKMALLTSELDKQRSLPLVLAQDPEVRQALSANSPASYAALSTKFKLLSQETGAAVIYLLDTRGQSMAASNFERVDTFVGSDYAFRPYFRQAMATGSAEYFALGSVSGDPGLYLSRQVLQDGRSVGVVVVKVTFDRVEANWQRFPDPVFVTDEQDVVLLSSVPAWRFSTQTELNTARRAALRDSQQFGDAAFERLPLRHDLNAPGPDGVSVRLPGRPYDDTFVHVQAPVPGTPWRFHFLGTTGEALLRGGTSAQAFAALLALCLLSAAGLFLHRRLRVSDLAEAQEAVRQELETRVAARTRELRDINARLVSEMEDRRRAESELQKLQEDMVQANKLAFLGQITAGVAHEINQPVAAIRSYADNAAAFLQRSQVDPAQQNMQAIAALTERIGVITDELRTFSRKASGAIAPMLLEDALNGALTLMQGPLHRQSIAVQQDVPRGLQVMAERVRLEQVLVNLLQNAVDALAQRSGGLIRLSGSDAGDMVRIVVSDNGPGIPKNVMAALFTPFVTTKPRGLGLGLVISRDIMTEFGGSLSVDTAPGQGARFTLTLCKAAT